VQTRATGSWNNRVWIALKPLLIAEIGGRRVEPDERVLVAWNSLELVGLHVLVALCDGLPINISGYNAPVSTRFLTPLQYFCLFFEVAPFMVLAPLRRRFRGRVSSDPTNSFPRPFG
jgi:hypothetical protein